MSVFDELLAANARYVAGFTSGRLEAPPTRHLVILTCMDARMLTSDVFGLAVGDAHVLRNAGGRVTDDALRSLLVSTHILGTRAVAVVHHTECGMAKITDAAFAATIEEATGHSPGDLPLHAIEDPGAALEDDVAALAGSPLFPAGTEVAGFFYDVRTGVLSLVVPPIVVGGTTGC